MKARRIGYPLRHCHHICEILRGQSWLWGLWSWILPAMYAPAQDWWEKCKIIRSLCSENDCEIFHNIRTRVYTFVGWGDHWSIIITFQIYRVLVVTSYTRFLHSNRLINKWNQLDQWAVCASSINLFKRYLNKREFRIGLFMDWSTESRLPQCMGFLAGEATLHSLHIFATQCSQSDDFPVFTTLSLNPTPLPPPTFHTFHSSIPLMPILFSLMLKPLD